MNTITKDFRKYLAHWLAGLFLLFVIMAPCGCSRSPFDGLQEGKVVYDVVFDAEGIPPMIKAMLPSEITTYFSNERTCTVISMGMNVMETRLISDASRYTYTTLVHAMGQKKAMVLNKEQVKAQVLDRVPLKITYTGITRQIAGVTCREAMITDSTQHTYPVYYTDEIALTNPNWCTPFHEIKGLLMEYTIRFGSMSMKLKAKEIVNEHFGQEYFEIPKGYETITDPSMMKLSF